MAPTTRSKAPPAKAPPAKAPPAQSTSRRGVSVSGPTRNVPSRRSKLKLAERGFNKSCPEMSVVDWSCRPMKNIELAFVMECWVQAWPWLTSVSRAEPFNMLQTCVFNALPKTRMGNHRDNASVSSVRRMTNGQLPFYEGARYAGVPNSQKYGSNVVVYSMCNDPMSMVFACPNPLLPVDQETKKYIEHPCLSFQLGDGYLSILDAVDDIGFTHGSRWEDCELHSIKSRTQDGEECVREVGGDNDDLRYRVAFVMRRCTTVRDFYTDTSTIRLDEDMIEAMKGSIANNNKKG